MLSLLQHAVWHPSAFGSKASSKEAHFGANADSVFCSDAKEVLFAKHGLEPTAAQLLEQALLFKSTSHSVNVPLAQQGGAFSEHGGSTGSFLTALLGPGLEAVAVQRARQDR
eukprot:1157542-Pelagomonas_calceolata.AAC.1